MHLNNQLLLFALLKSVLAGLGRQLARGLGAPMCLDGVHGDSHSHQAPPWREHNGLATSWVFHGESR